MEMDEALAILAELKLAGPEKEALKTVLDEVRGAVVVVEAENHDELRIVHPHWVRIKTGALDCYEGFSGVNAKEKQK